MKKIYHIEPVYKEFIWGGRKLIDRFGLKTDMENLGTIYSVIAIPGHLDNKVQETGEPLSVFYQKNPALFQCNEAQFPVRMTITCNEGRQSYQLHPDDDYAYRHEGSKGKVSGAVAIDESDHKKVHLFGHKAKELDEFKSLVAAKNWDALFQTLEVKSGDYLHTPAGVIHGGEGTGAVMVTFSSNGDITYRFYDYDRNEPDRPLHLQQVFDCLHFPELPLGAIHVEPEERDGIKLYEYYSCPGEYVAKRIKVAENGCYQLDEFMFITCVGGKGAVQGVSMNPGETLFIPAGFGRLGLAGHMDLMVLSYLPKK